LARECIPFHRGQSSLLAFSPVGEGDPVGGQLVGRPVTEQLDAMRIRPAFPFQDTATMQSVERRIESVIPARGSAQLAQLGSGHTTATVCFGAEQPEHCAGDGDCDVVA
jgi:hypothetical protein